MKNGKKLITLLAFCTCVVMLWHFPALLKKEGAAAPRRAQRQLITVWMYGDPLNAAPWVKKQAAAYQQAHAGVNIWVRMVTEADLEALGEDNLQAAPDLLLFMADAAVSPDWVQRAEPLCMAGYALVTHAKADATIAPTSIFGVTPSSAGEAIATPVPQENWPTSLAADDQLGAFLLQEMGAPAGARLMDDTQVLETFLQHETEAALLSTLQIRALVAQQVPVELLCAAPGSDLVLFGALMQEAEPAADTVLRHFLSEAAQRALSERGLISAQGVRLYGAGTPVLQAVETALRAGWRPEPFLWPREKIEKVHLGQLLYAAK